MLRKGFTVLVFMLGLLLVVGCQQAGQATATPAAKIQRGGTLRFGQLASPANFDPTLTALSGETRVWLTLYNTLLKLDADLKLAPELA